MSELALQLNDESLTLDQKLALIDQEMNNRQAEVTEARNRGLILPPVDPSTAFACEGCQ